MAKSNKKRLQEMLPPERLEYQLAAMYPTAWRELEYQQNKSSKLWPSWCYIPFAYALTFITLVHDWPREMAIKLYHRMAETQGNIPAALTAVASWRRTRSVYRFDSTLVEELIRQTTIEKLPVDVLYRLPEWSVYIELPGDIELPPKEESLIGFFAHLDHDINDGTAYLRLLFLDVNMVYTPFILVLADTLEATVDLMHKIARENGMDTKRRVKLDFLIPYIQMVLYLCADNADMPFIPRSSSSLHAKGKILPIGPPRIWDVGVRLGAAIRNSREISDEIGIKKEGSECRSPRPHVRHAHWHHYRTGPKREKLELRWIAPTFVGDTGNIPVVIRDVD